MSFVDAHEMNIENTRWVSFDIQYTREGFKNACWIARLAEHFNMHFLADPGKFDIKRRKSSTLFISLQVGSLFELAIMM